MVAARPVEKADVQRVARFELLCGSRSRYGNDHCGEQQELAPCG